jgi:hypothetical protein
MLTFSGIVVGAALWVLGLGLVCWAARLGGTRPRTRLELLGYGLLVGLGVGPAAVVAAAVAAGGPPPVAATWAVFAAAALGAWAIPGEWRKAGGAVVRVHPDDTAGGLVRAAQALGVAGILGFAAFAVFYAASMPMHLFDPLYHFAYKGKLLMEEGLATESWMVPPADAPATELIGRPITHPNYPPGLAGLHTLVGHLHGSFNADATRALMSLFLLGSAALLWVELRRRSRGAAILGTFLWLSLPLLYFSRPPENYIEWIGETGPVEQEYLAQWSFSFGSLARNFELFWVQASRFLTDTAWNGTEGKLPDGWTLDGAADLPLAAVLLAGVLALWRCIDRRNDDVEVERGDGADALIAGLCLGSATLIKNEGLALVALCFAVLLAAGLLRPGRRRLALGHWASAAAIAALVAWPWLSVRGQIPSIDEDYPLAIKGILGLAELPEGTGVGTNHQPTELGQALARIPIVALGFLTSFVHVIRWHVLWPLFFAALAWWSLRPARFLRHGYAPLILLVLATMALYAVVLLVTPWDLAHLYGTTIPGRLLLHVAPLALLIGVGLTFPRASELRGAPRREDDLSTSGPSTSGPSTADQDDVG